MHNKLEVDFRTYYFLHRVARFFETTQKSVVSGSSKGRILEAFDNLLEISSPLYLIFSARLSPLLHYMLSKQLCLVYGEFCLSVTNPLRKGGGTVGLEDHAWKRVWLKFYNGNGQIRVDPLKTISLLGYDGL